MNTGTATTANARNLEAPETAQRALNAASRALHYAKFATPSAVDERMESWTSWIEAETFFHSAPYAQEFHAFNWSHEELSKIREISRDDRMMGISSDLMNLGAGADSALV